MNEIHFGNRSIGKDHAPLIIAEIGINHGGSVEKAVQMIDDAANAGCECVKFQCHILEDEMIPNQIIPNNANDSIWNIIKRCSLTEADECFLKEYTERKNMLYLSTPFSREAANRLERMNVQAYKIGSGECNNYPLIKHIAKFKKPIFLSTGMNDIESISCAVTILQQENIPFCIMHCTSVYPTPTHLVRLNALSELKNTFPDAVLGYSDHTLSNLCCLGAISLGASVLEKHFTSNKSWSGPDIKLSMSPKELRDLLQDSQLLYEAIKGSKSILEEEKPTIHFSNASVVSIKPIKKGEILSMDNIWVKRPGIGEFKPRDFESLLGKPALCDIPNNTLIKCDHIKSE